MVPRRIDQYRIKGFLGSGRTSEVYCAWDSKSKKLVAIKLLHEFMTEQQTKQRFIDEARIVEILDHPGIIRVIDVGFYQQTRPYLVMNYASGNTLRNRHPSGVPLPIGTILSYTKQLADALAYAHQHDIVHCDVKPENILLSENGSLLLSDFGIARIRETTLSQTTRDPFGTAVYMAPEQFRGKYSPATDQYALAIMVYEWLCGHPPFSGRNQNQLMDRHLTMPVPLLREIGKVPTLEQDILEEVEQVVLRALAKEPRTRFSSIQAFAQAFTKALRETAVESQPFPFTVTPIRSDISFLPYIRRLPPTSPQFSRRPIVIGLVGLLLIGGTGLYLANTHLLPMTSSQRSLTSTPILMGTLFFIYTEHHSSVTGVSWSPDGRRIASASDDGTVQVWNAADGSKPFTYTGHAAFVTDVSWSPDGRRIASTGGDNTVQVWNAADGSKPLIYKGNVFGVQSVSWSPDRKHIAFASYDGTVHVWNAVDGGEPFVYTDHVGPVRSVAWSLDGKQIASAGEDKTVRVWNAADGSNRLIYKGHVGAVNSAAWSPDGKRIASASDDKTVQVWNAAGGGEPLVYQGHVGPVRSVAWSPPDGKRIASAGNDETVRVWNAVDGGEPFVYKGHQSAVSSVAWSPDGKRIASASADYTVQVWSTGA